MNRRDLFASLAAAALAPGELWAPKKAIFLPPKGGWISRRGSVPHGGIGSGGYANWVEGRDYSMGDLKSIEGPPLSVGGYIDPLTGSFHVTHVSAVYPSQGFRTMWNDQYSTYDPRKS